MVNPKKKTRSSDALRKGEKAPEAESAKGGKSSPGEAIGKQHFAPPRDRQALTGKDYIPANLEREYVPAPRDYVSTRRESHPTPSGRPYFPAPSANTQFTAGSPAVRQLESRWNGGVSTDAQSSSNPLQSSSKYNSMNDHLHMSNNSLRIPETETVRQRSDDQHLSSESDPMIDNDQLSTWIPPHRRKRKSEEMGIQPRRLEEESEILKRSKTSTDQQNSQPPEIAVFENGMRKTLGRGHMNSDYTGIILPLLEEFNPSGPVSISAPWLNKGKDYVGFKNGIERLNAEVSDFVKYMARTPLEIRARTEFTKKIMAAIRLLFSRPGSDVKLYGSDATGLGLPTSDIDLMIIAPSLYNANPYTAKDMKVQALEDLKQFFAKMSIFLKSTVRGEAQIPILEMEDLESGLEVDISFEEPHSAQSLDDVALWYNKYGHERLITLVILMKHALNIRKLGLGTATTPYQGGVGSYIILCMVIVFLEIQFRELNAIGALVPDHATLFVALLKFWGVDFNYETTAITVNPPELIPKSPFLPSFIFEVRSPFDGATNIASGAFGMRHIRETLKHFYTVLVERIQEIDNMKNRSAGIQKGVYVHPGKDCGILGTILAGNYENFERRRNRVVQAAMREESRSFVPPHLRGLAHPPV